jgi:hypothetical protein
MFLPAASASSSFRFCLSFFLYPFQKFHKMLFPFLHWSFLAHLFLFLFLSISIPPLSLSPLSPFPASSPLYISLCIFFSLLEAKLREVKIWMGGLPTEEAEEQVFVMISKSGLEVMSHFYFFCDNDNFDTPNRENCSIRTIF